MESPSVPDPSLLACFYEGISKPQRLGEGLQRMGQLLGCDRVSLRIWDRRGQWGCRSDVIRREAGWALEINDSELPEQALRALLKKFEPGQWKLVEQLRRAAPRPDGSPGASDCGGEALLCTRLLLPQAEAMLALGRKSSDWHDVPALLERANPACRALLPALYPIARLRQLGQQTTMLSTMLNSFSMPMMLLDASRRPLAQNAAAASLFRMSSHSVGGRLAVSVSGVPESQFSELVRRAVARQAAGGIIGLQSRPGAHLLVLPLVMRGSPQPQQVALVLVQGMSSGADSVERLLQHLYGFTPAEARLAQLILDGQSPGDAASALRVSVATIRTQLSAVLKKTGAQRQSDLVRRLSPLLVFNHGADSY